MKIKLLGKIVENDRSRSAFEDLQKAGWFEDRRWSESSEFWGPLPCGTKSAQVEMRKLHTSYRPDLDEPVHALHGVDPATFQTNEANDAWRRLRQTDWHPDHPAPMDGPWAWRDKVVLVSGSQGLHRDEVLVKIKHFILRGEKAFERMRRDIQAFNRMERTDATSRESIPREVRHEVWQRDGGRCVRCGSREKLEFGHIVPVVKGGSNTARNIELLCESCNRHQGTSF